MKIDHTIQAVSELSFNEWAAYIRKETNIIYNIHGENNSTCGGDEPLLESEKKENHAG